MIQSIIRRFLANSSESELFGYKTFVTDGFPDERPREPEKKEENIHNVDRADDLAKSPGPTNTDTRDLVRPTRFHHPDEKHLPDQDLQPGTPSKISQRVAERYLDEIREWRTLPGSILADGKTAARITDLEGKISPRIVKRSRSCTAKLKRADRKNKIWIFAVNCGQGPHLVKVKAIPAKATIKKVETSDIKVTCDCGFFRFQGPEYHAKTGDYLYGKPRGLATAPEEKDPRGVNLICKHVLSAFGIARRYQWR
jgi:hypothetical protein